MSHQLTLKNPSDHDGQASTKGPFLFIYISSFCRTEKVNGIPAGKPRDQTTRKTQWLLSPLLARRCRFHATVHQEVGGRVIGVAHEGASQGNGKQDSFPYQKCGHQCSVWLGTTDDAGAGRGDGGRGDGGRGGGMSTGALEAGG